MGVVVRNIFDQYSQPENRISHALMTALNEDRTLLGSFLRELVGTTPPCHPSILLVLEQQYPGELEASEDELERRGIPDGWIFDEDGWCVFIEIKVTARLLASQIRSHQRAAERLDFAQITAVAIVAQSNVTCPPDTVLLEWRNIYAWLCDNRRHSPWAARTAAYLEIAEAQLIEKESFEEGTLTMFAGFPFSREEPFTYMNAKRVLNLACDKLRGRDDLRRDLGVIDKASGRGAIKGRKGDHVWDFLALWQSDESETFTKYPHLTLGIDSREVAAMVTIPNAVDRKIKRNLAGLGEVEFHKLVEDIVNRLGPLLASEEGAVPWFRGVQRRWSSINANPFLDARIEFDLRTAFAKGGAPKNQPLWLPAAYGSFVNKQGSNYEIQVGVQFPYERCSKLNQPDAIGLIAEAWLACKPLVDVARR